jgi:hypothetical protein
MLTRATDLGIRQCAGYVLHVACFTVFLLRSALDADILLQCPIRMRQVLQDRRRPSFVEHIRHVLRIDSLVGDDNQCPVVATHHAGEGDRSPLPPASRRSVTNISQARPQHQHRKVPGFPLVDQHAGYPTLKRYHG